jgi:hypothetical protein
MHRLYPLAVILILSGCTVLSPVSGYKKSLTKATAERWAGGARGSGRGVTFRLHFYQLETEIKTDTLWVNDIPLTTEVTHVGDTTFVNASYFSATPEQKSLANDLDYSGHLQIYIKDQAKRLPITTFTIKTAEYQL